VCISLKRHSSGGHRSGLNYVTPVGDSVLLTYKIIRNSNAIANRCIWALKICTYMFHLATIDICYLIHLWRFSQQWVCRAGLSDYPISLSCVYVFGCYVKKNTYLWNFRPLHQLEQYGKLCKIRCFVAHPITAGMKLRCTPRCRRNNTAKVKKPTPLFVSRCVYCSSVL
jgi:hypothetical protein